jgi:omega-amidase
MRISILQTALYWEQPNLNRSMLSDKIAALNNQTDLIVLPEMFTTGFSMNTEVLAEPMDGATMDWLRHSAATTKAALVGSFICSDEGQYFNRLVFMRPNGHFDVYNKHHLFGLAGEQEHFTAGQDRLIVEWLGWQICPLICYDLRFPVWSRNTSPKSSPSDKEGAYDLLLYIANWPTRRAHHWQSLLMARAIENQCFTIGVNIVGQDGNGLEYQGDSAIVDFAGQALCRLSAGYEGVFTATLDKAAQDKYRRALPFLADADRFILPA